MAFWWVNHKQTFAQEIVGGFIWSPKENRNGARNQTYINLTLVKPGDLVISYAFAHIQAIGVATAHHTERAKPSEFGAAGDAWSQVGWLVPIDWHKLSTPISPKKNIEQVAPLLPAKNSPIRENGNGNQACYLAAISHDLGDLIISIASHWSELPAHISGRA
mgnify:CR=1 FL=1